MIYNKRMFDVITIGTGTRDVFLESKLFRIIRAPKHLKKLGFPTGEALALAAGAKIEVAPPIFTVGGGAANAAVTFARQGFKAAALMKLGADENGDSVISAMKRERVAAFPLMDKKDITAYSAILLSPTGERTILNYRGASEDMKASEVPYAKLRARWAYFVPGRIPLPVIFSITKRLQKQGTMLAMNPSKHYLEMGPKKLAPLFKMLDVVIMNREEAAYLTGCDYAKEKEIFKNLDKMVRGVAVMTDGPRGVLVSDGRTMYRAGIYRERKLVNRTGAGDAFGSGFVAGLIEFAGRSVSQPMHEYSKEAISHAIRLGSANATSVVEHIGAEIGILRKHVFKTDRRWRTLPVAIKKFHHAG